MSFRDAMRRLVRDEGGLTLAELLVAMVMMLTVLFALYAVFDASLRVFGFGNDKVEAVQGARLAMEKMRREVRAAYPYDADQGHLILENTGRPDAPAPVLNPARITFGNDLDGRCGLRVPDEEEECEETPNAREIISYYVNREGNLIRRSNNLSQAVARSLRSDGLEFVYLDAAGNPTNREPRVALVRITLTVEEDGETQTLTTDVALRNRLR